MAIMTDKEFEKMEKEDEQAKKLANIKSQVWLKRGYDLVYPEKYDYYKETMEKVANSGAFGIECMDNALEVMELLDSGASVEDAVELFDSKELDGSIFFNTENLILNFSKRGPEFEEAYFSIKGYDMPEAKREAIENIKAENQSYISKSK